MVERVKGLSQLGSALLGNAVIAPPLAFDRLALALDPTRLLHLMQQRVQRAWTDVMAGLCQILAEFDARDWPVDGSVKDAQPHEAFGHIATEVDHRSSISYNDIFIGYQPGRPLRSEEHTSEL